MVEAEKQRLKELEEKKKAQKALFAKTMKEKLQAEIQKKKNEEMMKKFADELAK